MKKQPIAIGLIIVVILAIAAGFFLLRPKNNQAPDAPDQFANDPRYLTEPTGLNLIQAALDDGKINLDTALIYKIKFLFNDPTLPKEYFTKNAPFEDGGTFAEIQENWDKLSEATKKTLAPYFLRPDNPESFISKIMNGEIQSPQTSWLKLVDQAKAFDRPITYKTDDTLNTTDGKIKVWYPEKKEIISGEEKITKMYYGTAQKIVANLNADQAYAQFVGLLGKIPPVDGTLGGDNKLDIYVGPVNYSLLLNNDGSSSYGVNAPDNGNFRSSFIIIRENLNDKNLKTTTVHEIFHAFQRAFDCWLIAKNLWWIEGTATWSEDFIYPKENSEQGYTDNFIPKPQLSLNSRGGSFEYGAYVFPFYLTNTYDRGVVTKVFEGCKAAGDPLDSVEKNIDGGFKKNWKEFTLWNYNKKPIEKYKNADQSKAFPAYSSQSGSNADMTFLAPGESPITTKELPALTSQVIETFFSESTGVRKAVFTDLKNFTGKSKNAAIKAVIYPKNNGEPYIEDWTDLENRSFCFDKPEDNFDKIILIFSNAELKNKIGESKIKVKTKESCFEINQGETMTSKPIFGINPDYVGTVKYQAEGELVKDSVPAKAKYVYLGKWKVKIIYREDWPGQTLYGITQTAMYFSYDHTLEFDLSAESVEKDGTFEAVTKEGKFETPGWTIHNEISGQSATIPKNTTLWDVPQKGVISEMTENGCKISLPEFVLYNSGGYRDLPHPIIFEIKK
ncbi:MAG: hypothetical protein WC768_02830 [Patescibacteria group bacterium]|jgi:hypothetical protein